VRLGTIRNSLFAVFALSGFSGLIYESIWSHYFKLLLGHASYAQTLVLCIFMGGMALGAGICGRITKQLRSPLLAYAGVELALGIMALGFDPAFRSITDWLLESVAPSSSSALIFELQKWAIAAAMILPACVLLGATFPLISAGVLRLNPSSAGNTMGWLYFTNSLGAVIGVLTSGFFLIGVVGLPGTLLTAGLCNFLLAIVVYVLWKNSQSIVVHTVTKIAAASNTGVLISLRPLLATAFLTGAASFLYEVGWIRMLSLVLGSATHSFELMLGAFIFGLALGALYIRNRIDEVEQPLRILAWVQVLMATAALGSLVVYGWSFGWMAEIVQMLSKTDGGYKAYTLLSQVICWALMLPVTVLAGMTLPLITTVLFRSQSGEAAIGKVYAANTWGAIAGILVAAHIAMPYLGLRNVVVLGAGVDLVLGLWLFSKVGRPRSVMGIASLVSASAVALLIAVTLRFDNAQLSSGVFRHGREVRPATVQWYQDGKTASVAVATEHGTGQISIVTNGKPDASLSHNTTSQDDYTQISLAVIPLALRPEAERIAVIGMGSGRSTHVFLGSPNVDEVHTIEIEPAMVDGARLFGDLVHRTFNDPRSHIHIDDAKTFLARHQEKYDIIMSEPSNPWVSGVASLFTKEFYRQVRTKLATDGIYVQWLQLYEFDDRLLASVIQALGSEFSDYAIYALDDADILIAAVAQGEVPLPTGEALQFQDLKSLASSVGLRKTDDIHIRFLGTRRFLQKYAESFGAPANSDYFPYLDQNAAEHRFKSSRAHALMQSHPVLHRLSAVPIEFSAVTPVSMVAATELSGKGFELWAVMDWRYVEMMKGVSPLRSADVSDISARLGLIMGGCDLTQVKGFWEDAMQHVGSEWLPYMDPGRALQTVALLRKHKCSGEAAAIVDQWLDWMDAIAQRDWVLVSQRAEGMLRATAEKGSVFVLRETLLADYQVGGPEAVRDRLKALGNPAATNSSIRLLTALAH
jgi:spermidine synthase